MRGAKAFVVTVSVMAAVAGMAAPAHAGCSVYYSGTDARQSCSWVATPGIGQVYMNVTGYAFAVITCNNIQVFSSGLRPSGSYSFSYLNPGGFCRMDTGVNGTLYAYTSP